MMIDHCCLNFDKLDAMNHIAILDFFDKQLELHKVNRELLMRYLSLVVSELKYEPNNDHLVD
jgi:hypothetical protein